MDSPVADVEDGEEDGEQGEEEQILARCLHFVLGWIIEINNNDESQENEASFM